MKPLVRALFALFSFTLVCRADVSPSLRFLAIGDSGSGKPMQKEVADAMAAYAKKSSVPLSFVLVLGDNFYEDGVTSTNDPQWQTKFEKMYDQNALPVPFLAVLGNHDWRGDLPDVEIDYAKVHPESRWKMDGHWYKRHFQIDATADADFFFLDSGLWDATDAHVAGDARSKKLGEEQMDWLTAELQKSKATWKFVAAHQTIYSNGHHGRDRDTIALRERLVPLFKKYNVDAYFSGHDHDLQRIVVPDVPTLFLVSGAAGHLRGKEYNDWKPFYESTAGFLSVQVSSTEMRGQFINSAGKIIDVWHRRPSSLSAH